MKDTKSVSLLFIALLLLLLAALVLLYKWGYNKFYKKQPDTITLFTPKNQNGIEDYRDSLQKIYTSTINNINPEMNTTLENVDSLNFNSEASPAGFFKLKTEIEAILKKQPLKADLDIARQKIFELQNNLAELKNKNISVEDDNKRLNGKLNQLANEIKSVKQNIKTEIPDTKINTKIINPTSLFTVSQLRVSAIMIKDGLEQETIRADQTDKFSGSFLVKNNLVQQANVEIFVVVLQPDGHVMQGSAWESGAFEARDGRKIYSSKLLFEYSPGESKRLSFLLSSDTYQKGKYTIHIYYNGIIIGKEFKTLF